MRISKLLALILALLMLVSAFSACNSDSSNPKDSSTESEEGSSDTESGSTTESASESETEKVSILNGVTFEGTVLNILNGSNSEFGEYVEEITEHSDLIDQAVFNRCDYAETRLKVSTKWTPSTSAGNAAAFVDEADRENRNGGKYDIIFNKSTYSAGLMTRGVLSNLMQYNLLDFASDGWAHSMVEDVAVGNKLYFATGDISVCLLFMTSVVYFNKDMVKDFSINQKIQTNWGKADLYELVESGTWTLDKMITLTEGIYLDTNNSGKKDSGDRVGFNTYAQLIDNFFYGGGYTTVVADDGAFAVGDAFLEPTLMGNLLEQVNEFLHDSGNGGVIEESYNPTRLNFAEGKVLFSMAPASHAYNTHSNADKLDFGVLPVPKHSESQNGYACTQSFPYNMYSIASQGKYRREAAAFMQALSEESYEVTRPAIFDKMMKGRYSEEPEDAMMWNYAIDSNVFDAGRIFQDLFKDSITSKNMTVDLFRDKISENNANWSGVLQSYAGPLVTAAAGLAGTITALPD